ncbi:MAG TPA: NEW3 domain-containing protein [Gemmatimonadales bacterium]|nr:NEW3 domain-containing protein [Gemmatimonadales bacterium]
MSRRVGRPGWPWRPALAAAAALVFSSGAAAQSYGNYNPRDDQYRLLGMTRAQAEFESALREYNRARELRTGNVISDAEVELARTRMEGARVNYLQAALAIVFATPYVMIDRALKIQRGDQKYVRVTLRTENQSSEGAKLGDLIDSTLLRQLNPEEVPNVFVALKDDSPNGGAIIGQPYEIRIPALRFGQPVTVEFRLLRDVDVVTVSATYANQTREPRVFLEKDASANIVTVQAIQPSQEGDLGTEVRYELQLERFTSDASGVRLEVGGLPREIRWEFRDPVSGARLTSLRFPEGATSQRLTLALALPARDAGRFPLDQPVGFWALALDAAAAARYAELARDSLTDDEARSLSAGRARLELLPRGIGRLEVRSPNFYHAIARGDSVVTEVTLRNTGSRAVTNIRLSADPPPDWRSRVDPELVPDVAIDAEARVRVTLVPPPEVGVGDYDVRLRTDALSADRTVQTEDKTVRVHVEPQANWVVTSLLVMLLLGVVGGVVVFGYRLTRR